MSKQDRAYTRTASDLERKYNFGQTFADVYGLVSDAQRAAEEAREAVDNLDATLSHEEIFNRLTNGGLIQGIYRGANNDIYINASYIQSGLLAAEYIDADNLKVKAANITGTLTIGQLPDGVAQSGEIPTKVSSLVNDAGYQTETGVTTIVGGVVTTDYVNALGISVKAANIEGTLAADQIVLTGAITWGDLSSDVQNSINSAGGISAWEAQNIASTVVTNNLVASPNIVGATITGGTIIGADFLGETFNVTSDGASGSFNLIGPFGGHYYNFFQIRYWDSLGMPIVTIDSPDGAPITFGGESIGIDVRSPLWFYSTVDFSGATVTGLSVVFG